MVIKQLPQLFLFISLVIAGGFAQAMEGDYHPVSEGDLEAPASPQSKPANCCFSPKFCSLALGLGTAALVSFIYFGHQGLELGSALEDNLDSIEQKMGGVQLTLEQSKLLLTFMLSECKKCIP